MLRPSAISNLTIRFEWRIHLDGHAAIPIEKCRSWSALARVVQTPSQQSNVSVGNMDEFSPAPPSGFLNRACRLLCLRVPDSLIQRSSTTGQTLLAELLRKMLLHDLEQAGAGRLLGGVARPAPIFKTACTNPASCAVPSAMQYSSHAMAARDTPPAEIRPQPSMRNAVMNCASLRHARRSGLRPADLRCTPMSCATWLKNQWTWWRRCSPPQNRNGR